MTEDNSVFTVSHLQFYPAARKDVFCGVHLPSGATVTKLSVNGSDVSETPTWNLVVDLYRDNFSVAAHSVQTLTSVTVSTSGGRAIGSNTVINNAVIDNENYFYTLKLAFPTGDGTIVFNSARINYTFTQPY